MQRTSTPWLNGSDRSALSSIAKKFGVGNNPCLAHSQMLSMRHWTFCPHCGIRLQFIAHCDECGKNFTSEKAFAIHNAGHFGPLRAATARHDKEVRAQHRIVILKRRNAFYCADCRKEIGPMRPVN